MLLRRKACFRGRISAPRLMRRRSFKPDKDSRLCSHPSVPASSFGYAARRFSIDRLLPRTPRHFVSRRFFALPHGNSRTGSAPALSDMHDRLIQNAALWRTAKQHCTNPKLAEIQRNRTAQMRRRPHETPAVNTRRKSHASASNKRRMPHVSRTDCGKSKHDIHNEMEFCALSAIKRTACLRRRFYDGT